MVILRTNRDKLAKISVIGEVVGPTISRSIYRVSADGEPLILPGTGASPTTSVWVTPPAAGRATTWSQG